MARPGRGLNWEQLAQAFAKHQVDYLIIGKSGAVLLGFPETTQDIDIFPRRSPDNGRRIIAALQELGFSIDQALAKAIQSGKDFIQIRGGPIDLDLVFAPDALDSFEETKAHAVVVEDLYPVASIEEIIRSKERAARQKDKEVLERLKAFARYLRRGR